MTSSRLRTIWYRIVAAAVATVVPIVVVISTLAMPAGAQTSGFGDVPEDAYFATPVADLHAEGVFNDTLCEEGFCPGVPIDRRTMAVWTVRVLDGQDPPAITRSRFDDVDPAGYHAPFIERLAELSVTRGCGDPSRFCPDRNVTRAEMAAFLSRAFNLLDAPNPGFDDVPDGAWYASDVAKLAASGITVGCGGTRFCPDRDTTRGQMATFLHRANERHKRIESIRYSPSDDTAESTDQLSLAHVVQQGTALCLQPPVPPDLSDHVEILRIESNGCLTVTYEPLNGRTLLDVRREYVSDPEVIAIDLVYQFLPSTLVQGSSSSYWHYEEIDADTLNAVKWPNGTVVEIAIVDTGIDANHVELSGRVIEGGGNNSLQAQDVNGRLNGHGTFIAGLIGADPDNGIFGKGVAPEAILSSYKTGITPCDKPNEQDVCDLPGINTRLAELRNKIRNNPNRNIIVNMSFGSHIPSACSSTYTRLIDLLKDFPNFVLIAAGGNYNKDLTVDPFYPSGCPNVLEVAASDSSGALATGWWSKTDEDYTAGSNYGPEVVIAPGDDLTSLEPGGGEGPGRGTSYAAPLVAGVAAHLMAWFPEATGSQIIDAIQQSASHGSSPDQKRGYGFIRPLEAIKYLDDIFNKNVFKNVFCKFERDAEECEPEEDPTEEDPTEEDPTEEDPTEEDPIDDFPVVRLEVGNSAEGAKTDSGPCSALCRYLRVEINDEAALSRELGPGPYTLACAHNGAGGFSRGVYADADEDVSVWPSTNDCFFGFPGSEVFVIVGAEHRDGTWYGGIYSNTVVWPNCTVEPDRSNPDRCTGGNGPALRVWRGGPGVAGDCTSSSGCEWVHGAGSDWTPGAQYWIKCGNFVDTQQNRPVTYYDRFVDSAGNLSWGDRICLSDFEHSIEVWTNADGSVRTVVPAPDGGDVTSVPDRPTVVATVNGTTIQARWSADDNGSRIERWHLQGPNEVDFRPTITNHVWRNLAPGRYTLRVRAENSEGWSQWGQATVTVGEPVLRVWRGGPGVAGSCTSNSGCEWVHGSGSGWPAGKQYWISCGTFVNTQQNRPVRYFDRFVDSAGNLSWGDRICLSNFEHSVEVWTSSGVRKKVTVQAPEPPDGPELSVRRGSVAVDDNTCPASVGCRWIVGSGSDWPAGDQFWISCGTFVNTQQNRPVNYRDRFVDSAGNLSWGESICYTANRTTVEVWTSSGVRKTVTFTP